jgi:hypothetical protein
VSQKIVQQDFFSDQKMLDQIKINSSVERQLKGLFARYNELETAFWDMRDKVQKLEEQKSP